MTDPVEQIRARAALVAGNPDVVKVQSVRDRAVLLEYVTELEVIIARVQEYAYMRNFYNQPMYISELLGIVGEPDDLSAVVAGGEATPTPAENPDETEYREAADRLDAEVQACSRTLLPLGFGVRAPPAVPVPAETPEEKLLRDIFTDPARRKEDGVPLNGAFPCQVGCTESAQHWHEMRDGVHWIHPGRIDDEGAQS